MEKIAKNMYHIESKDELFETLVRLNCSPYKKNGFRFKAFCDSLVIKNRLTPKIYGKNSVTTYKLFDKDFNCIVDELYTFQKMPGPYFGCILKTEYLE